MSTTFLQTISVVFLVSCMVACSEPVAPKIEAEPIRAIKYQVLGQDRSSLTRKLSGHILARESSQFSFQVAGQVLAVHVDVGDVVQLGDLIAELDATPYQFRLSTAQAELSNAQSALRERQENYRKQQQVFKKSYISKSSLDRAKAEYEGAESAVQLAGSQLALAQRDLDNTRLLAPFDGTVNRRDIEPFEDVIAARSVFEIQGTAGFEVSLLLPSRLLSAVERGAIASVAIPALGLSDLPGVVTERGIRADSRGAFPVTVNLDAADSGVQAGMSAEVTLVLDDSGQQLLLPGSAVSVGAQGRYFVFVFKADESLVRKTEVVTRLWGLDTLVVDEGLIEGDIVCVAGVEFLRDGQEVTLYESNY